MALKCDRIHNYGSQYLHLQALHYLCIFHNQLAGRQVLTFLPKKFCISIFRFNGSHQRGLVDEICKIAKYNYTGTVAVIYCNSIIFKSSKVLRECFSHVY